MKSQLNIRMDASLRAAGDAALAEMGYTAGTFIRALWTKLAARGKALEEFRELLADPGETSVGNAQEDLPLARMRELSSLIGKDFSHAKKSTVTTPFDDARMDREYLWGEMDARGGEVAL